jgi:hypothetical protein
MLAGSSGGGGDGSSIAASIGTGKDDEPSGTVAAAMLSSLPKSDVQLR